MFKACWTQSSRAIASSSSHSSSLHTSAVVHAQKSRQHIARGVKKLNLIKNEERRKNIRASRPSVILGTRPGDEAKWEKCLLAKLLVDTKELHSKNDSLPYPTSVGRTPTQQNVGTVYLPKETSFGIGQTEKKLLFGALPLLTSTHGSRYASEPANVKQAATKQGIVDTSTYVSSEEITDMGKLWKASVAKENAKANQFAALVDLRNANADGIAYENRMRIIQAFSTPENPFNPGRSEVQAALLTYKIRNLWWHLDKFKRDLGNRRFLRMLVHQRAKVLKYLKKVDQARYEVVLEQLALEPESVEGELVV
ncbi:hypothetical protein H0H87_006506 [Tephrocybe sp. NHM501043]|nr:hypothetical protein H0H87_006506 [Tephrocybe sp. NHM501043]